MIKETPIDLENIQSHMFNFSTTLTVFDDLGDEHTATILYRRRPDLPPTTDPETGVVTPGVSNQWEWYLAFDGADLGARAGNLIAAGGGFLQFDNDGRLLGTTGGEIVQQDGIDPATKMRKIKLKLL